MLFIKLLPLVKIIAFGLLFLLAHVIILVLLFLMDVLTFEDFENEESNVFRIIMIAMSVVATILTIVVANRLARSWKPSLPTLGITASSVGQYTGVGLLIGGMLILVSFGGVMLASGGRLTFTGFPAEALLYLVVLFVAVSLAEELLFRGYLLPYLLKHYATVWAIVLSSVLFAAMHLGNDNVSLIGITNIFLAGVLFAQLRIIYQNLWVPLGVHFIWNYLQGAAFGFSVSGIATESILVPTFDTPSIINGGEFGLEGSIITVFLLVAAIILLTYPPTREKLITYKAFLPGTSLVTAGEETVVVPHQTEYQPT